VISVIRNKIDRYNEEHNEKPEEQIYVSDRRWRKIIRLMRSSAFINGTTKIRLMDCFLIKHCIWNDKKQIQTVCDIVNETITEHGCSEEINIKYIEDETAAFLAEIDGKTKFVTDGRVEELVSLYGNFYEIINPPNPNCNLIKQDVFKNLTVQNQNMNLFYRDNSMQPVQNSLYLNIRKGDSDFSIFINETPCRLKTVTHGDAIMRTQKPDPVQEGAWDDRVAGLLLRVNDTMVLTKNFWNTELEYLRTNLFLQPELSTSVESHGNETLIKIEKTGIKIREIQNNYKKLKDEEVTLDERL
jgi:MoxR-like ATPase